MGITNEAAKISGSDAQDAEFEANKNRFTDCLSDEAVDDPNEYTFNHAEYCGHPIA
jgi:hypothetical protein